MGGGGGGQEDYYKRGKLGVGFQVDQFLQKDFKNYDIADRGERSAFADDIFGSDVSPALRDAVASGGYVGLTGAQRQAIGSFQGLQGGDAGFGRAERAFENNRGINQLGGINYGGLQSGAERALQGYDPQALRQFQPNAQSAVNFNELQRQDPSNQYLRQVGSGEFLTPDSNPFLRGSIEAAQRPVLDAFQQRIQPGLAAQFGGGFGVGGSASMNAQRLAAEGVTRNLSDSATRAYAGAYAQERGLMDNANQFLSNQQLQRGQSLGQLQLGRAQGIDASRFARAQGIDASRLSRAQGLAQSGLGFANARVAGGSALANASNARAAGLSQNAAARGAQRLAAAQGLLAGGTLEQRTLERGADIARQQYDSRQNPELIKMQLAASLMNNQGPGTQGASRNRAAGAAGGALSGAATGASFGGVYGAIGGALIGGAAGYL